MFSDVAVIFKCGCNVMRIGLFFFLNSREGNMNFTLALQFDWRILKKWINVKFFKVAITYCSVINVYNG